MTTSGSPATFLPREKASEPLCYSNLPSRGLGLSKQKHVKGCFTSEQGSTDTNNDVDLLLLPNFLETGKSVMRTKPLLAKGPGSPLFKKQAKGQTESSHKETVHILKDDASLPLSQLLKMRQFSNAVNHGVKESWDRKSNLHASDRSSSDLAVEAESSQSDGSSPLSQLLKLKKSDALNKNASECMDANVSIDTKAGTEYSYETVTEEESSQNIVHIPRSDEFSPLSQLLKSRQSKSPKCSQYNASERCYRNSALPNAQNTSLLPKGEDMVRIPNSDGSSPLSQLLKMRKSPGKTVKCGATEGINSNSEVDSGKKDPVQNSPSPKSSGSSLLDQLLKRGKSHIHENTRDRRMNCVNSLHGNKDIDLSLLLRGKKSEEKVEKIPKESDFYKSRSANCRLLSNSSKVDGSQIQSLKRKESFASKNSLFQDSIGEKCEEITRGLGRLSYGNSRKSCNDTDDMVVNGSEKCSNDMEDGLIMEPIHSREDLTSLEPVIELLHAPSTFACALLVQYKKPGHEWKPDVKRKFQAVSGIAPFDFSTPSPDDIVMKKQKDARMKRK